MAKSISLDALAKLAAAGIEAADEAGRRDMQIHAGNPAEQARAAEYRRGQRHGIDDLLRAAENYRGGE